MRFRQIIVLSGLFCTVAAMADGVDVFEWGVEKWSNDKMSGVAEQIDASIEGDAFTVCYKQSTGSNYVFAVNNVLTGELMDVAALSALEIHGMAYSSSMGRLAISFLDLQGVSKTILFGDDGLPMRTFPGTTLVGFDPAGVVMAVGGGGLPYIEVANLATGESTRVVVSEFAPLQIAVATENGGGVVGASGAEGSMCVWDLPTGEKLFTSFSADAGGISTMGFAPGCTYVGGGGDGGGENSFDPENGTLSIYALPGSGEVVGQRVYFSEAVPGGTPLKIEFTASEDRLLVTGSNGEALAVTAVDWRLNESAAVQISVAGGEQVINDFAFAAQAMVWAVAGPEGVTAFEPDTCPADLDRNNVVDGGDLAVLLGDWYSAGGSIPADLNGDGIVDGGDLSELLGNWGSCPQ